MYSAANFCNVNNNGNANNNSASNSNGVRPISEAPLFGGPVAKGKVVYGESLKDSGIYMPEYHTAYSMLEVTTTR